MNKEEKKILMKKLEEEFEELLFNKQNVKNFLYIPHEMLTPKIKKHLDEILFNDVYDFILSKKFDSKNFIVYSDSVLTIKLNEHSQKVELLDRLINYFSEKEEYEKCNKLLKIKKKYNL
jgi:hypothetical protein